MRYFSILSQQQPTASVDSLMSQTTSRFYNQHSRNMQNCQRFVENSSNNRLQNDQATSGRNVQQDQSSAQSVQHQNSGHQR